MRRASIQWTYRIWEQKCDECLDFLQETFRNSKRLRISIGVVNASIARIARLEGLRNALRQRFEHWALAMSNRKRKDFRGDRNSF